MKESVSKILSIRLKEARLQNKISQERLGILAGIDENSASARMNQYEKGKHIPDYLMMTKIAEVLHLPVSYFYEPDEQLAEIICNSFKLNSLQKSSVIRYISDINDI